MVVRRIVANIAATDLAQARRFYGDVLGLDLMMDHGWIATWGNDVPMTVQVSVATEGGSGTPVPDLSVEVDDLAAIERRLAEAGMPLIYGPADEPWGVRRLFVHDPFSRLVNILEHRPTPRPSGRPAKRRHCERSEAIRNRGPAGLATTKVAGLTPAP